MKLAKTMNVESICRAMLLYGALLVYLGGFYDSGIQNILMGYLEMLIFAVIGFYFISREYFGDKFYLFCFLSLLWFAAAYWLRGEMSLAVGASFSNRCLLAAVAVPFACFSQDARDRKHLDRFLTVFCTVFAALLWLCYIGMLRGKNIVLFGGLFEFGAFFTYTGRIMLKLNNMFYYLVGFIALACFFVSLYLAVSHWSGRSAPVWILFLVTFFSCVLLTYSRAGVVALAGGLLLCLYLLLQRLPLKKGYRNTIFAGLCGGGVFAVILGMNYIYKAVHSIRDFWYGITTLSSRTTIWAAVPKAFADYPSAMLTGLPSEQRMEIINCYLPELDTIKHMHNGFLEVLVQFGIPGLLIILVFCTYLIKCCWKVFFAAEDAEVTFAERLMVVVPAVCIAVNFTDSILFCDRSATGSIDFIVALFSGYIIERSRQISAKGEKKYSTAV